jgi:anthranilate synthase component 2
MNARVLVVDNYDSFTWNLVHLLEQLGAAVEVRFNDDPNLLDHLNHTHAVVSPGPGLPQEAGQLMAFLHAWPANRPLLGVCLGHQALALDAGAALYNLPTVMHGLQRTIHPEEGSALFEGLPRDLPVGLYHSWAVDSATLPPVWRATAQSQDGVLMAMEHRERPWFGVQFHPESVMTPQGLELLAHFLRQKSPNLR